MQDKITVTGDVYVNQHLSDLLCSLTHGQDRWITAQHHHLDRALSFAISSDRTFQVLGMKNMIHMHIPSRFGKPHSSWLWSPAY